MSQPTVPAPVRAMIDATNAGNTGAFLDTFTSDGLVNDWGREFRGRDAIKKWSDQEFIGAHCQLAVISAQTDDNRAVLVAQVTSSGFNGRTTFTFELDGGAVSVLRLTA